MDERGGDDPREETCSAARSRGVAAAIEGFREGSASSSFPLYTGAVLPSDCLHRKMLYWLRLRTRLQTVAVEVLEEDS